jgi:hypothetical protein
LRIHVLSRRRVLSTAAAEARLARELSRLPLLVVFVVLVVPEPDEEPVVLLDPLYPLLEPLSFCTRTPEEMAFPRRACDRVAMVELSVPVFVPLPDCAMAVEPAPTQSAAAMPSVHVLVLMCLMMRSPLSAD